MKEKYIIQKGNDSFYCGRQDGCPEFTFEKAYAREFKDKGIAEEYVKAIQIFFKEKLTVQTA